MLNFSFLTLNSQLPTTLKHSVEVEPTVAFWPMKIGVLSFYKLRLVRER